MITDCDTYGDACDPVAGRSKMRQDLRLSIFSILPFPLGENTSGRISKRSGNVEGPGALLTSKQIFFGGNAKVGAGLFAGEIELNTCCVAMVKLLEVVELSTVVVLLTGPNLHLPSWSFPS